MISIANQNELSFIDISSENNPDIFKSYNKYYIHLYSMVQVISQFLIQYLRRVVTIYAYARTSLHSLCFLLSKFHVIIQLSHFETSDKSLCLTVSLKWKSEKFIQKISSEFRESNDKRAQRQPTFSH